MPSSTPEARTIGTAAAPPRFRSDTGEDLGRLARLAYDTSATRCQGCRDYHTMWPYLRSRGLTGAGPEHNLPLQLELLLRAAGQRDTVRWLVAGAADAGLFALVSRAAATLGSARHAVTVVDRCETPLALSRAHAASISADVETVQSDLLDLRRDASFDVVLMHQLLKYFSGAERLALLRHAYDWLAPGGALCMSVQEEPPEGRASRIRMKAWRADALRSDIAAGAFAVPEDTGTFLARLDAMGGMRRASTPLLLGDCVALIEGAGLGVAEVVPVPYEDARLPPLLEGSLRHMIVARRAG